MSFALSPEHSFNPEDENNSLQSYIDGLFDQMAYAQLKVEDLRKRGLLKDGQSLEDYVREELGIGESFEGQAIDELAAILPVAISPNKRMELKGQPVFPPGFEKKLKLNFLANNPMILSDLVSTWEFHEFRQKAFSEIGVLTQGEKTSYDPNSPENMGSLEGWEIREQMQLQQPRIVSFTDRNYFAFKVVTNPSNPERNNSQSADLEEYAVVSDRVKNRELTEQLVDTPAVLRFYLALNIYNILEDKKHRIEAAFRKIAEAKMSGIRKETSSYNLPFLEHAFQLFVQEVAQHPVEVTLLYRSNSPALPVTQKERVFAKRGSEDGVISFSWIESNQGKLEKKQTDVRVNKETGSFEFRVPAQPEFEEWSEFHRRNYPDARLRYIVNYCELVTPEQRLVHGPAVYQDAMQVKQELLATPTVRELFAQFAKYQMGNAPDTEIVIVPMDSDFFPEMGLYESSSDANKN
jgi:hypothetical protein